MILIILTPVLMLTDYFLTLLGKKYKDRVPHFQSNTYELNPALQNDIDNNKKISYKHIFYTALFTFISYVIYQSGDKDLLDGITGYMVTLFGFLNARHLGNILLCRYSIKNPEQIKGVLYTSHLYNLKNSLFQTIGVAMVFLLFVILHPTPFLIGAFVSQVMSIIHHLHWINKHNNPKAGLNEGWTKEKASLEVSEAVDPHH